MMALTFPRLAALACLSAALPAFAQTAPAPRNLDPPLMADPPAERVAPEAIDPAANDAPPPAGDKSLTERAKAAAAAARPSDEPAPQKEQPRDFFTRMRNGDDQPYSIVSVAKGLSTHKPMYILPATYSPDYHGNETEVVFAISAKAQLFGTPLYFAYSQKSFWQVYDSDRSRPFRETDYNPELFYRWKRDDAQVLKNWGADFGLEHESNGQDVPDSRSWNRVYVAPFRATGSSLLYIKAWYRIPEDKKKTPDDPKGDDNPDIDDHYGYGEVHWQRQIGKRQLIHTMVRLNPDTGHGAININYTIPSHDGSLFYMAYLWHGYGESLLDYNDSVTRVGLGVAFSR